MLRGELAHMSWHEKRPRDPLQARVLEQLTAMDIAPDVAVALAARTPKVPASKDASNLPVELLATYLRGGRQAEPGQRRRHRARRAHGRRQDDDHRQIGDALEHAAWQPGSRPGEHGWVSCRGARSADDVFASARCSLAYREQRRGAGAGPRAPQIQETDPDRHRRHGTAGCASERATRGLETRAPRARAYIWRCRRMARPTRWTKPFGRSPI